MRVFHGVVFGLVVTLAGCDDKPSPNAAPTASALASAKPQTVASKAFSVETGDSSVTFLMDAPVEKIFGEAKGSLSGELFVDLGDLGKSTGLVNVDLEKLELFQQKRDDEKAAFGERSKSDLQNKHARTWLEISDDVPAETRQKNAKAQFEIEKIEKVSANPMSLSGAERKITATVVGSLLLHGRKAKKQAPVELTFTYEGDTPKQVRVKSTAPIAVGLEEFDVRPRDAFGKLAQKALSDLASKVAKEAPIELDFVAKAKP